MNRKTAKVRRSWGPLKPITRIAESKKRYTRKGRNRRRNKW